MLKRLTACLLSLLLVISMLPAPKAAAEDDYTWGDWKYKITEDGEAEIIGYLGSDAAPAIPSYVSGFTVSVIGNNAFKDNTVMQIVYIPETVREIRGSAFSGCTELTGVRIDSLDAWCRIDFQNASANPIQNRTLQIRQNGSWRNVTDLSGLNWPDAIGAYAFAGYKKLKSAELPYSVQSIGDGAFSGCSELETVTFPSGLTSIGKNAFSGCGKLTELELPDSLTNIGDSAFSGCRLTKLVFPSGNVTLGSGAFSGCNTTNVYLDDLDTWCALSFPDAGSNPLNGAENLHVKNIPTTDIVLSEGITTIEKYTFYGFKGLKGLILPDGVTNIYKGAFQNCSNLEVILFPDTVESIAADAFNSCTKLTDVYYTGSEAQWGEILNADRFTATVHCGTPQYTIRFYSDKDSVGSSIKTAALGDRGYVLPAYPFYLPYNLKFKAWQIGEDEYAEGNTFKPEEYCTAVGGNAYVVDVTALKTDYNVTISFAHGEGSGTMNPQTVIRGNASYQLPKCTFTAPVGKKFSGWRINGVQYEETASYSPWSDVTVIALWTDITYTVTYDPGEGSGTMENGTAYYGRAFTLPESTFTPPEAADPAKPQHFKAWKIGDTDELIPAGGSFVAEKDTKVTAIWADRVALSFDHTEGTGEMETLYAAVGNTLTLPECSFAAPEKMTFKAWKIGDQEYDPNAVIEMDGDKTAEAVWVRQYRITYDPNGGTGTMAETYVLEGETLKLPECSFHQPEEKGSFKTWMIGEEVYQPSAFFTPTEDTVVKAVWKEMYTLSFAPDGETEPTNPITAEEGTAITLPGWQDCGFTAPDDTGFKAWSIDGQEYGIGGEYVLDQDRKAVAVWTEIQEVTFDKGDDDAGGTMDPMTAPAGTAVTLPNNSFTAPYAKYFKNWSIGGVAYDPGDTYTVTENTVVTAIWDDVYFVTFKAGGGSGNMATLSVRRGESATLPVCEFTAPSGGVFEAWEMDGAKQTIGTTFIPTQHVTVTAVWNYQYEYSVNAAQTTVTRYKDNTETQPVIPRILGGYPVTAIGTSAFSGHSNIQMINIPEGVSSIGENAFMNCGKLVQITVPSSVSAVSSGAFSGCSELTGVYITDLAAWCAISFENASANPLSEAKNLYLNDKLVTVLTIPSGVSSIGDYAFYQCDKLTKLETSSSGITRIGSRAFEGCTGLVSVTRFPNTLQTIGSNAFTGCSSLTTVEELPTSLTSIESRAFSGCKALANISIPSSLTQIEAGVFSGCSGLKNVTIPASITAMQREAFSGCQIDAVRVSDLASWCRIDFADSSSNPLCNAKNMYIGDVLVTDLVIADEITSVNNFAFYGFQGLQCVIIPQNAAIIYRNAFTNCGNLAYVMIPVGLRSIGDNAFANCAKLKDVYFTGTEAQWREGLANYQQLDTSSNSNITVHYNAVQISVTMLSGEGSGAPQKTSAISGRPYMLTTPGPNFTAPAGQQFKAWQYGEQEYEAGTEIIMEEDVTLTALWEDITYHLSFSANGGTGEMKTLSVTIGDSVALPACGFTPQTGKQFSSWRIDSETYLPGDTITPAADMVFVAEWEPLVCEISFDPNGGTGTVDSLLTTYRTAVTLPECTFTPPEGMVFKAWKVNDREREPGYSYTPTESVTVTAVWQIIRCTITYHANGGTGSISDRVVNYGGEHALVNCYFTAPEGKAFRAWLIDGERHAIGETITVKKDTDVTALWVDKLQISFLSGGGGSSMSPRTIVYEDVYELPECGFRPQTGMQFSHWQCGTESYHPGDKIIPAADMEFTAVWMPIPCTITFVDGYGHTETMIWDYGHEYELPACMFEDPVDLQFKAWKRDNTEYAAGARITPTSEMTFTVVWTGLYLFTVDEGKATITGYTGEERELTIPTTRGGYPVTAIGASAFAGNAVITAVTIPEGVTSIGAEAFSGCSEMKEVTMPDSLLSIERRAFYQCRSLGSAKIPEGVTTIGRDAFNGCGKMTAVTLPKSLKKVENNAFSNCAYLTAVYISDLESWCGVVFENANSNPTYKAKNLYLNRQLLTELTFPEDTTLTSIGSYAFYNCDRIESVTLPKTLQSIGSFAFYGCTKLGEITIPRSVTELGSSVFSGCVALTGVELPAGITLIPESAFSGCRALTRMDLPETVTDIGNNAFNGCEAMTELTVPVSVKVIGSGAFGSCGGLVSVYINDLAAWCRIEFANADSNPLGSAKELYYRGVLLQDLAIQDENTDINPYSFYGFKGLRSLVVPNQTTKIYNNTFTNCSNLEYILLPAGMEEGSLGTDAFKGCKKLTDVYFTGTEEQWKQVPNYYQFEKDTITVHYNAKAVLITFDSGNGETETTSAISGVPYKLVGCVFGAPKDLAFKAWKLEDTEYAVGSDVTPEEDLTFTAVWTNVLSGELKEGTLSYRIYISIPKGAMLVAAGYSKEGQQLWTSFAAEPQASGELTVKSADKVKLFLIAGGSPEPLCLNWESPAE